MGTSRYRPVPPTERVHDFAVGEKMRLGLLPRSALADDAADDQEHSYRGYTDAPEKEGGCAVSGSPLITDLADRLSGSLVGLPVARHPDHDDPDDEENKAAGDCSDAST